MCFGSQVSARASHGLTIIGSAVLWLAVPAIALAQTTVAIDRAQVGAAISSKVIGTNMGVWFDPTQTGVAIGLKNANIKAMRWPGGSMADLYHWQTNTTCPGGYANPNATFNKFMTAIVKPLNLDLAVTLNYGSNAACNGGGDPLEAAAWVANAKQQNYKVNTWTVGNENYGSWETDMHAAKWDPMTYAQAVATGYYPAIKAADPNALVGVVVDAQSPYGTADWDKIVLANARYDFVEYHWYAQGAGYESDSFLLSSPVWLTASINTIKQELAAVGKANTPIMIGELGSVVGGRNKQMMSITQALFAGQALGELMNAGVSRAHWYTGYGDCYDNNPATDNYSSSLYGWQNFGGYEIFSDGLPYFKCQQVTIPQGTLFPTAQALKLMSLVALDGEHMIGSSISGTNASAIRAYAMTNRGGNAVVLFNLDRASAHAVTVNVPGVTSSSAVTVSHYDRAIYDRSKQNVWAGTTTSSLRAQRLPLSLNLTPWSMTVVQMAP